MLHELHPAVRIWFERRFPDGPTEPQDGGWRAIGAGRDTLIAAPTGSGKTLAAFLVCIDRLYRGFERDGELADGPQVVYVSPLKALAVDIHQNLEAPLAEIAAVAEELGQAAPDIRVAVRTGDTAAAQRAAMLRRPPHIVVTTPESLYLLVTAEKSRELLGGVETVIVDEIHAVAGNKRGSHLALTLERLTHVAERRPQRVGLSATQRPIDAVARLLVGASASPECAIVDVGHKRELDLALELVDDELSAVASAEQMALILDRIAEHVQAHRTTLVFVNTRRLAERVAHQLGERLGEDVVAAHHGSLSKDRRHRVETRLRAGELRALVATASLELGIDIGPVELVCQLGSPRSLGTFLQRVGRSNHTRTGTPKGILYPTTRDELVECAGLLHGVKAGRLDALIVPEAPLDILAQQVIAECAAEEWSEDALFELVRRAAPFAGLSREDFDEVLELVSEGIQTGRGRRAAYVHRDQVNGLLRGRRAARLAAMTSGGAIPEQADYRVVAEPDDTLVGTVNEDWAIESMAGDVFLLGTSSWRIRRVEPGTVRVVDAHGAPPSVPFWLGEAPGRTLELSEEVSRIRAEVQRRLQDGEDAEAWLREECGVDRAAAEQIVRYLGAALAALGALPTLETIVLERFFDESGGMQLIGHAPFGARLNRAFGLALRKRFCVTFDFELQAAASDDAILLSLGLEHSFPLEDVPKFLASRTVEDVVTQAVLTSPMFAARWRWNLNRSLAVLRMRGGKRNPPPIQRMESDDLMAAVFPTLAACQENVAPGPMEIPDQPLVRQTVHDCLHEAMDVDGLRELVRGVESGRIRVVVRDTTEPSVLAHEILNGQPFTFLDDAPLEERRSRAVQTRRGLPVEARDLGNLDAEAIERVRAEVRPDPRDPDELHDLLMTVVALRPEPAWRSWFDELVADRRAITVRAEAGPLWAAVERRPALELLYPDAEVIPRREWLAQLERALPLTRESAAAELVRGHLEHRGPSTAAELSEATALPVSDVTTALIRLEVEGFAFRGHFTSADGEQEFCARRLLSRIHGYTRQRLRAEIAPVTAQEFMRFLLRWQHAAPGTQLEGRLGVHAVIAQLQGFELAAGAWEDVLAARVQSYRRDWLDDLCMSGDVTWGRLTLRRQNPDQAPGRSGMTPSRATPITLAVREDLPWLLQAARGDRTPPMPEPGRTLEVVEALAQHGALFPAQLISATGRLPSEVDEALWEAVAHGMVTADGFRALRALLYGRRAPVIAGRHRLRRGAGSSTRTSGRWSLLPSEVATDDPDELAEAVAEQLLARWGVVFRDLLVRDTVGVPWREVLWALRRMEARGTIRGGRFVSGFTGEQYAVPEAVEQLRAVRKSPHIAETVRLPAADPLNLAGIVLPGPRVPALPRDSFTYVDGVLSTAEVRSMS